MPFIATQMWLVSYGGGIGPDVWDDELTVTAETIQDALLRALMHLKHVNADVTSIEYYDGERCSTHLVAPIVPTEKAFIERRFGWPDVSQYLTDLQEQQQ